MKQYEDRLKTKVYTYIETNPVYPKKGEIIKSVLLQFQVVQTRSGNNLLKQALVYGIYERKFFS